MNRTDESERARAERAEEFRAFAGALEAMRVRDLLERARAVCEDVRREYLAAIDGRFATPRVAQAELLALRWGETLARAESLVGSAQRKLREAERAAEDATAVLSARVDRPRDRRRIL